MKNSNEELLLMDPVEVYKLVLNGTIRGFPYGFFSKQRSNYMEVSIKIIKYLIEEKLKWNDKDICDKLSFSTFKDNKLSGMLNIIFNGSPFKALNSVYPDKYKPWQLSSVPNKYWNKERAKEAIIWLIEEKLRWSDKQVCEKLSYKTFVDNGLIGMLKYAFNSSVYEAIDYAYPGKYKPWEFSSVPKSYWNKKTAKEATIWLIEEKLKWNDKQVCESLSFKTFEDNGLKGMINLIFNSSPYKALNNAYPGKYIKVGKKIKLAA